MEWILNNYFVLTETPDSNKHCNIYWWNHFSLLSWRKFIVEKKGMHNEQISTWKPWLSRFPCWYLFNYAYFFNNKPMVKQGDWSGFSCVLRPGKVWKPWPSSSLGLVVGSLMAANYLLFELYFQCSLDSVFKTRLKNLLDIFLLMITFAHLWTSL